ncbi:MAG: endolytic transglycosylase MltG [Clostridia bacterium]|nr:endolytic transglycosylase MltG [Clostridia bacterium]
MKFKQLTFSFVGTIIRIVIVVIVGLLIYKAGQKAYDFGYRIFAEEPMSPAPGRDVEITIGHDKGTYTVAKMLQEKGLIRDAKLFYIQEKLSAYKGKIQPGFYTLNTSMSAEDMMKILSENAPDEDADTEEQTLPDINVDGTDPAVSANETMNVLPGDIGEPEGVDTEGVANSEEAGEEGTQE